MKNIFNALKNLLNDSGEDNTYSPKDIYLAHRQIYQALTLCLYDLYNDSTVDIIELIDGEYLDQDVIAIAEAEFAAPCCAREIMSVESKEALIKSQCLHFYAEALIAYKAESNAYNESLLNQDDDMLDQIQADVLKAANEELREANDYLHERLCAYMGYDPASMNYDVIIRATEFACDNNMIDGKTFDMWFPAAVSYMPQEANENPFAPPSP